MPPAEKKNGFTLLEIMVSITLLALMALMISRVFNESTKAIERGRGDVTLDETARLLLDSLEQDISQALIRTNVAFKIYPTARNGSLYFVSPAVRKQHDNIRRDMAPIRITSTPAATGTHSEWNRAFEVESADETSGSTEQTRFNLIGHSDYYITNATQSVSEFGNVANATFIGEYTRPAGSEVEDHAVLTFLDITVNADPAWNYNNSSGQPDPASTPRFVDISFGLISSAELKMAQQKDSAQHIENHERIFARRIFLRNTGTGNLNL